MSLVVALGGNEGDDDAILARFQRARAALVAWTGSPARSSAIYRTAAIGGPAQPDYLNAAVALALDPTTPPADVIARVLAIEAACGRDRAGATRWGPRAIDLDVIAWRDIDTPALTVPHPRAHERRFVLAPLLDLFGPAYVLAGATLATWLATPAVAAQAIARTDLSW